MDLSDSFGDSDVSEESEDEDELDGYIDNVLVDFINAQNQPVSISVRFVQDYSNCLGSK